MSVELSAAPVRVSVVVPTYRTGDGLNRLVGSLDAQTMPADEFEVVFVDDGSPDDTYERLRRIAASRPNVRAFRIANSGWPSRPRNVGIENARGEYVLFMDHDDELYPDALRRSYEFAAANDADVVNPLEFKTNSVWWMPTLRGNVANALTDGGIERLMPFMPHKLYRRQLLLDRGIRFPERRRALWEDWYVNVEVYRHARVVSVLADTPFYLRHMHGVNTSSTFDIRRREYWERLDDIMRHIETILDGPGFRKERAKALARHLTARVIDAVGVPLRTSPPKMVNDVLTHARRILARYLSDDVFSLLSKTHRIRAYLLRAGQTDLLRQFDEEHRHHAARTRVQGLRWDDGQLIADVEGRWTPASKNWTLRRDGERVVWGVNAEISRALPPELLDVTADGGRLNLRIRAGNRNDHTAWDLPFQPSTARFEDDENGRLCVVTRGRSTFDLDRGAFGAALSDGVWDVRTRALWNGAVRYAALLYGGGPVPLLRGGRGVVAYSNKGGALSVDMVQRLRNVAVDAAPRSGPAGSIDRFSAVLDNITVVGPDQAVTSDLFAVPENEVDADGGKPLDGGRLEELAARGDLQARVISHDGVARLEGGAALPAGRYHLYCRIDGKLRRSRRSIEVTGDRQTRFD